MAKSRKGKIASKRLCISQQRELIERKFKECPINERKDLFLGLEDWAKKELNEQQQEIFLEALYSAEITQSTQMEIALDKGLAKIRGEFESESLKALEQPEPLADINSTGKSWAERELARLTKLKRHRPLTEEEEETYYYCKGTLESEEFERVYLNGGYK